MSAKNRWTPSSGGAASGARWGRWTLTVYELTIAIKPSQVFSMQVPASTVNGTSLPYALLAVNPTPTPVGLTVSSTGMLRWIKTVKGTYQVTVMVTDALGLKAPGVNTLTVM